jgi:hypothetical protein
MQGCNKPNHLIIYIAFTMISHYFYIVVYTVFLLLVENKKTRLLTIDTEVQILKFFMTN